MGELRITGRAALARRMPRGIGANFQFQF
jgi:hypothetical protein